MLEIETESPEITETIVTNQIYFGFLIIGSISRWNAWRIKFGSWEG
jgi:hypothetical protein